MPSSRVDSGSVEAANGVYWQEEAPSVIHPESDVVDLAFSITCRCLPLDHAWALSQAVGAKLPWWEADPLAGLHLIHGAESGNGWHRPETGESLLYLTRRTKLVLRLPRARTDEARSALPGAWEVAGFPLAVGEAVERALYPHPALYARHVVTDPLAAEADFLAEAARELRAMAVRFKKMLSGKTSTLQTPEGPCTTRSLMVADLAPEDSMELARRGIGPLRILGCGLFVPCKTLGVP